MIVEKILCNYRSSEAPGHTKVMDLHEEQLSNNNLQKYKNSYEAQNVAVKGLSDGLLQAESAGKGTQAFCNVSFEVLEHQKLCVSGCSENQGFDLKEEKILNGIIERLKLNQKEVL